MVWKWCGQCASAVAALVLLGCGDSGPMPNTENDAQSSETNIRTVSLTDISGALQVGTPVLRHSKEGNLLERTETDGNGVATLEWRDGNTVTALLYFDHTANWPLHWVHVRGFEELDHLALGYPERERTAVGTSSIRAEDLEPEERVFVNTACDVSTIHDENPQLSLSWYDSCSDDDDMLVLGTAQLGLGGPVHSYATAQVRIGEPAVLRDWQPLKNVSVSLPNRIGAIEEIWVTVRDGDRALRRYLGSPASHDILLAPVGEWHIGLVAERDGGWDYLHKDVSPADTVEVLATDLAPPATHDIVVEDGKVVLRSPDESESVVRSTLVVLGDLCDQPVAINILDDGRDSSFAVPSLESEGIQSSFENSNLQGWATYVVRQEDASVAQAVRSFSAYRGLGASVSQLHNSSPHPNTVAARYQRVGTLRCPDH